MTDPQKSPDERLRDWWDSIVRQCLHPQRGRRASYQPSIVRDTAREMRQAAETVQGHGLTIADALALLLRHAELSEHERLGAAFSEGWPETISTSPPSLSSRLTSVTHKEGAPMMPQFGDKPSSDEPLPEVGDDIPSADRGGETHAAPAETGGVSGGFGDAMGVAVEQVVTLAGLRRRHLGQGVAEHGFKALAERVIGAAAPQVQVLELEATPWRRCLVRNTAAIARRLMASAPRSARRRAHPMGDRR